VKYAILIYDNESNSNPATEDMDAWGAFTQEVMSNGKMSSGEALQPTATATTVRVRDGQTMTSDGPFAETKEQLGGFYILDCADLDEAIAYAARIPSAPFGSVEVRPVIEFDM
jgi:hypothetical protein